MPRCLFVNWNDGHPASQFTVSDDYRLSDRLTEDGSSRLPNALEVLDVNAGAELYLDLSRIRSAFVIDIGPDQTVRVDLGALKA